MTIRLVDSEWSSELIKAVRADSSELRIVCPFIKIAALERLLANHPTNIQVITRFNLADFAEGVSDISALRRLLNAGGRVRGIKNLHAKLYLFGTSRAIVTSANLTQSALDRNQEFGIVSSDPASVATCLKYFKTLWKRGDKDLSMDQLDTWDDTVTHHRAASKQFKSKAGLKDFGADAGIRTPPPVVLPTNINDARQAFVKFLGEGHNRAPLDRETFDEIQRAGCHWAVAYPASKRPSAVKDDAVIFIARLTKDPNDIRVFGRAIGLRHVPGRDDASPADIALRPWKEKWPRYIRVHHAEFVAGPMSNGISLNEIMDDLKAESFLPTQRNALRGDGNTDPRKAYRQQAAVELSIKGRVQLAERLQAAFDYRGKVPQAVLDNLDWPELQ